MPRPEIGLALRPIISKSALMCPWTAWVATALCGSCRTLATACKSSITPWIWIVTGRASHYRRGLTSVGFDKIFTAFTIWRKPAKRQACSWTSTWPRQWTSGRRLAAAPAEAIISRLCYRTHGPGSHGHRMCRDYCRCSWPRGLPHRDP